MKLRVSYEFLPKRPSSHASVVMDHFGIGFETGRHVIAEDLDLPVRDGDVILFTGPSGSGKSSLMRALAVRIDELKDCRIEEISQSADSSILQCKILNIDSLDLGERALVDALELPVHDAVGLLSSCGLGEARLLLRTPAELSDGQRYRFRLALALSRRPNWIVADEFTATLDRTLARIVAFNIRRLATGTGTGFLLATTHDDIVEDLQPSLHVACRLDGRVEWTRPDVKKKRPASPATCGSAKVPSPTGRTSLGGITEPTTWAPCGSSRCCGTGGSRVKSRESRAGGTRVKSQESRARDPTQKVPALDAGLWTLEPPALDAGLWTLEPPALDP